MIRSKQSDMMIFHSSATFLPVSFALASRLQACTDLAKKSYRCMEGDNSCVLVLVQFVPRWSPQTLFYRKFYIQSSFTPTEGDGTRAVLDSRGHTQHALTHSFKLRTLKLTLHVVVKVEVSPTVEPPCSNSSVVSVFRDTVRSLFDEKRRELAIICA